MQSQEKAVQKQESSVLNTVYERLTERAVAALRGGLPAADAWQQAQEGQALAVSTLAKGCPRSAFVSLSGHGHVKGVRAGASSRPPTLNAQHALVAAALLRERPELLHRKQAWWAAVQAKTGTTRCNHNGVLDVMRTLIVLDAFQAQP